MNPSQTDVALRPYNEEHDAQAVFELYQTCFQALWPLAPDVFHLLISQHADYHLGDHFVAEKDGRIVGFVATQLTRTANNLSTKGGIALLMVHPHLRRQGLGRQLHAMALHHLNQVGANELSVCHGNGHRLWQGVPCNLSNATAFFQACGWQIREKSADLIGDLQHLKTPIEMIESRQQQDIRVRLATPDDAPAILDFEAREFPHWQSAFQRKVDQKQFADIVIVQNAEGQIVGSLTLTDWRSPEAKRALLWPAIIGEKLGAIGVVGVAESEQGQGIGSAMVAKGAEIMKARGVEQIHIFWTGRVSFYERLGYTLWQEFDHMVRSTSNE